GDGTVDDRHLLARAGLAGGELAAQRDLHPDHAPLADAGWPEGVQEGRPAPRDPGPAPVAVFLPQRQAATRPADLAPAEKQPHQVHGVRLGERAEQALELARAGPQPEPEVRPG